MALHPGGCSCEGCKTEGLGFPAFEECESFPSPEHWNRGPMKSPSWGMSSPWAQDEEGNTGGPVERVARRSTLRGAFAYDASDFGRSMQVHHLGQAFVPGTVNTDIPPTAWSQVKSRPVFTAPGIPENPGDALAFLSAQGLGPDARGISPTRTLKEAQAAANDQDMQMLADGTFTPIAQATGIPKTWILGGLLAYLIFK